MAMVISTVKINGGTNHYLENGSKNLIINRRTAAIRMAGNQTGGYHFDLKGDEWIC